ncbi:MAG: hypothetical protein LBU04_04220 [Christensenellaceae bacterium]|jgi:Gpi18-like mannosyltransferase|nr:hypothetical protein [Christensenellaceae bacterium]
MKRIILPVFLIVLFSILIFSGCKSNAVSEYNVNVLKSGERSAFDYTESSDGGDTFSQLQSMWSLQSGGVVSSTFSIVDNGSSPNYLKIDTQAAGYAIASQKLFLKPYSYYKVQYTYTSASMSKYDDNKDYVGLYVGFIENPDFNIGSDKATVERNAKQSQTEGIFYFHTENVREATLAINLGTEDNPVTCSNVTLQDISLVRVTAQEAGENGEILGLYTLYSTVFGESSQLNLVYLILGGIGSLLLGYIFYMLRARSLASEVNVEGVLIKENKLFKAISNKRRLGIIIALSTAVIIRLVITLTIAIISGADTIKTVYFGFDLANNVAYASFLADHGPIYFLDKFADSSLLPGATYILSLAGLFGRGVAQIPGITILDKTVAIATTIKLFGVIADLGVVALIFSIIRKKHGVTAATVMASFYGVIPFVFFISSSVGSLESITVFFVVAAFYCVINKNYIGMAVFYFLSVLITPQALLAMPFVLMYTVIVVYQAIKERSYAWIPPVVATVLGFFVYYAISSPIYLHKIEAGTVFIAFTAFLSIVKGMNVYTANAFNFQGLIGNNFKAVSTESTFVTILFLAFIISILAFAYFKTKNRLTLVMLTAAFAIVYWYFCNNSQPNSILLAIPLLFIYVSISKDKRLFFIFVCLIALAFVNSAYLYLIAGYNLGGVTQIPYTIPLFYIFGSINLVLVIVYIIFAYDTVATKKARHHLILRVSYFQYVKSVAQNIIIAIKNFGFKIQALTTAVIQSMKPDKNAKTDD